MKQVGKKSVFNIHSVWFQNNMLGSMWTQSYTGMWIQYFACFYLTGQQESIPPKFWLAGVVLVVSKPHVFNLTGQLELKPQEFPTFAVTDPHRYQHDQQRRCFLALSIYCCA
jgi:hypothetical protein